MVVLPAVLLIFNRIPNRRMRMEPADRVVRRQCTHQARQLLVLSRFESLTLQAFEFDADRKIIAPLTPLELRHAGVPGAMVGPDELTQLTSAPDQKMGRYPQARESGKVGMRTAVECAGEQPLDRIAREAAGRQADVMNDQQIDRARKGALVVVVTRSERRTWRSTLGAESAPQPAANAPAAMARDNMTIWPR